MNRVAALSGSTGFLGGHLERHLQKLGWTVLELKRNQTTDSMIEMFRKDKPQIVFHLASSWITEHKPADIETLITSNLLFGTQIAEAMRAVQVKNFVNAGTAWQNFEQVARDPVCLYAATKNAFEEIIKFYVLTSGFRVLNLEIFETYGPGDPRPKLLPHLLRLNKENPFAISPGEQRLQFVHVDDLVCAFHTAAENAITDQTEGGWMKSYALSANEEFSLREVAKLVEEARGQRLNLRWGERPYRPREVMRPWSPQARLPGWEPKIRLREGLAGLVRD